MNFLYYRNLFGMLALVTITTAACGQNPKVKTITIIDGDTTISESSLDEELAKIEKDINITISEDGKSKTKIIKKVIISDDKGKDAHAMAYAYSSGNNEDADVEVSTDEKNGETKVIIKRKNDGEDAKKEKEEGNRKVSRSVNISNDKIEKLNIDLNVKGTTASLKIETGSKDPLNISVLDENGKQVFYDSRKDGSSYSKEIRLEKKGTYFLNIIQNKKSTTEKIIVE